MSRSPEMNLAVSQKVQEILVRLQHEFDSISLENLTLKEQLESLVLSTTTKTSQDSEKTSSGIGGLDDQPKVDGDIGQSTTGSALTCQQKSSAEERPSPPSPPRLARPEPNGTVVACKPSEDSDKFLRSSTSSLNLFLSNITSDPAKPRLVVLLESTRFELAATICILLNTLCIAVETQYLGLKNGYALDFPGYTKSTLEQWVGADEVFFVLERAFSVIFALELGFRICVLRGRFLREPSSYVDVFAVGASLFYWFASADLLMNPSAARVLRLGRLTRLLRIIKTSKRLASLRLLLRSIIASVSTLSWSVLLLLVIQCIAAMACSWMVNDFITDESQKLEARQNVFIYYGTFSRSMITMFEIHMANFAPACRILLDHMGEEYAYVFLCYRCIVGFAVLNVITAVFIQQTMQTAQQDHEIMLDAKDRAATRYKNQLKQMFNKLDGSGDGIVSFEELSFAIESEPCMQYWMAALEIDTHDLERLFQIIDVDGDGQITFDEFLSAAAKVKGNAKGVDMVTVLAGVKQLQAKVDTMLGNVKNIMSTSPRRPLDDARKSSREKVFQECFSQLKLCLEQVHVNFDHEDTGSLHIALQSQRNSLPMSTSERVFNSHGLCGSKDTCGKSHEPVYIEAAFDQVDDETMMPPPLD